MKSAPIALAVAAAFALGACKTLAPPDRLPELDSPEAFKTAVEQLPETERGRWKVAEPKEGEARGEWWKVFGDPVLDGLVADTMAGSPTLAAATARVTQARAVLGITDADRRVQLSAGAGPFNIRSSPGSLGLPPGTELSSNTLWRANATIGYEIDLFGRLRDASRGARLDLESSEATFESVKLALQADVARTYLELREADLDAQLLADAHALRARALALVEKRFAAGAIAEFDVLRARADLATTVAQHEAAVARRGRLENAIAVLVGRVPARVSVEASGRRAQIPRIPVGLPSSLLERRPDIVAAQRTLFANTARIGAAKAAFYPSINLTGTAGFEARDIDDVFRWSSRSWILGPFIGGLVNVPILDGGRNKARLQRAQAQYEEAVANYRAVVLTGFGEVEDNLLGLRSLSLQQDAVATAAAAAKRAAQLAQLRYDAGASSFLDVLDAQRTALDAQREENRVHGARATGTVALIRALGGGWTDPSPPAASADPAPDRTAAK
ncbi:MAG: efflux transporter outer membrane subunit [Burkholderiales bacterium]|jgi:multidrug efflux system outer membrane protein|nr:efflux transporter outer membrane subunit [Burkholderiales bacterium]